MKFEDLDYDLFDHKKLIRWGMKNVRQRLTLNELLTLYYQRDFTILNLINSSYKHENKVNFLILYKKDDLVAFARYKYTDAVKLSSIMVNPKYRRKGICTKMVKLLLKLIKERHSGLEIILDVKKENEGAIKCYKNNNFEIIGTNKYSEYIMKHKI